MTTPLAKASFFARPHVAAVSLYFVAVVVLGAVICFCVSDLLTQRAALGKSTELLDRLQAHRQKADVNALAGAVPAGSPFLSGDTVTVAGAALLQRVAGAITRFGGSIQSSQVDVQGQAKGNFVTLVVSCEIEQGSLQKLLYDIEAGMPFLFVDQLVVQAPQSAAASSRMSLLLAVSGRWSDK